MTDLHDANAHDSNGPAGSDESGLWESDALLDALGAGAAFEDDRMSALLSALVSDVSADPLPALSGLAAARRRRRLRLAPRTGIAAAAVAVVLSGGGVAAASVNAGPTSALFPLHQVLTGRPQLDGSQRQALEIKDKLRSAAKALAAGKVERAQKDVASAASRLPKVKAADGHGDLAAQWTSINSQVKAHAAGTAPAPAPAKATPSPARTPAGSPAPKPKPTLTGRPGVVTTKAPTSSPTSPAVGVAPTSGLTTPTPTVTSASPSPSPTTASPTPTGPATGTATPTPSPTTTKGGGKHHKPGGGGGKGGGGGTTIPSDSPPAPSLAPPTTKSVVAPITITPPVEPSTPPSSQPLPPPSTQPTPPQSAQPSVPTP